MSSSRSIWQELWISTTRQWDIWRENRMATGHEREESPGSAQVWFCCLLWDIEMWLRCVVSRLERDLWWISKLSRGERWRELWSVRNESMWSGRGISMWEWNVYPTRILSRWRTGLSRLEWWDAIQDSARVFPRECEYSVWWSYLSTELLVMWWRRMYFGSTCVSRIVSRSNLCEWSWSVLHLWNSFHKTAVDNVQWTMLWRQRIWSVVSDEG